MKKTNKKKREEIDFGFGVTLEDMGDVVTLKNEKKEVKKWKMRI